MHYQAYARDLALFRVDTTSRFELSGTTWTLLQDLL